MATKWQYVSTNEFGGSLYTKGEKNLLIFSYRTFMWINGRDSIIRERI
jgi:hypothetical protein